MFYMSNGELYHYGMPGRSGRYEWGTGERPYQRLEKPKKTFKQKRKEKKEAKARAEAAKIRAKRKAEIEESRKAELKKQQEWEYEQKRLETTLNKEKIMKEGKAAEVLKYQSLLSNAEMKAALERINTMTSLQSIAQKDVIDNWKRVDNAMKKVQDINVWASAAITAGKNIQDIIALLNGEKPKNQQNQQQGQKKQKSS